MDIDILENNNEVIKYKQSIMNELITSPLLAEFCKNTIYDENCLEDLVWNNYLPVLFVDDTLSKKEAYVMFDIDVETRQINTYIKADLIIQIYCHKDIARLPNGVATRLDAISSEIHRLIAGKNLLGIGYNRKVYDKFLLATNTNYTARQIVYSIVDISEVSRNGSKSRRQK